MAMLDDLTTGPLHKAEKHLTKDPRRAQRFTPEGHPVVALAARHGDPGLVALLLDHGADPDAMSKRPARPPMALSPLTSALQGGHDAVAQLLLERGASAAGVHPTLRPMTVAAFAGRTDWLERLANAGAPVDGPHGFDPTPLVAACSAGHEGAVGWLLDRGADPNRPGPLSASRGALATAVMHEHIHVVTLLLERGADPHPPRGATPFSTLLVHHNKPSFVPLLEALLAGGADPAWSPPHGLSAWRGAVSFPDALSALLARCPLPPLDLQAKVLELADSSRLELLLSGGFDANACATTAGPLHSARDVASAQVLLAHGADPERLVLGRTALEAAVLHGRLPVAEALLEAGASPAPLRKSGPDLLQHALEDGKTDTAAWLRSFLGAPAPSGAAAQLAERGISVTPREGYSALGNPALLRLLLEAGLSPDAEDDDTSLLGWAVLDGHEDAALLLLDAGATLSATLDCDGTPLLDAAVEQGMAAVLQRLFAAGLPADPWCEDARALEQSVRHDQLNAFAVLLRRVVDGGHLTAQRARDLADAALDHASEGPPVALPYLRALDEVVEDGAWNGRLSDGRTVLGAAAYWGDTAAVRWLLERGADPTAADAKGRTPLAVAAERGKDEALALLQGAAG